MPKRIPASKSAQMLAFIALVSAALTLAPHAGLPAVAATADPVLIAAGDIACDPGNPSFHNGNGTATACRQGATADLIESFSPDAVMPLGDTQYDHGQAKAYRTSYDPSWGRFLAMTLAVVGNHEYETSGASGYYRYFGDAAGMTERGYHSADVGSWHVVMLNSNCWITSCNKGSAQLTWLTRDLRKHPATCLLAAWHAPRWSSGYHGNFSGVSPFLRVLARHGADVVLNGHDHHYERFARMAPDGTLDPNGIREFVVGTGGSQLYSIGAPVAHSEVRRKAFGVLRLTLHVDSYDWSFERLDPGPADSGSATCSA